MPLSHPKMTDPLMHMLKSKTFIEACALHDLVSDFRDNNKIRCPEDVYQTDYVIQNAYEFIEALMDVIGYMPEEN
jgi:hypothetical protein